MAWAGGTANYGWWLVTTSPGTPWYKQFATSDHATAGSRPKLVVTYTLGGGALFASSIFESAIFGGTAIR